MAGVDYEFIEDINIENQFNDLKTDLIHHYDIYNITDKSLIYPDNIIIE